MESRLRRALIGVVFTCTVLPVGGCALDQVAMQTPWDYNQPVQQGQWKTARVADGRAVRVWSPGWDQPRAGQPLGLSIPAPGEPDRQVVPLAGERQ